MEIDIQKEREGFEGCYKTCRDYRFYVKHEMSEKQIFEFKNGRYVVDCVNDDWKIWQAAKAQSVPEGFVLVPKEPTQEMIQAGLEKVRESWDDAPPDGFNSFTWGDMVATWEAMIEPQEAT